MGASASIIDGENLLKIDYKKIREDEWGEGNLSNSARRRRITHRNSTNTIQGLAINQLSNTIQSNKTSKATTILSKSKSIEASSTSDTFRTQPKLSDTIPQYSRSNPHLSAPKKTVVFDDKLSLLSPILEEHQNTRQVSFQVSPTSGSDSKFDSARSHNDVYDEETVSQSHSDQKDEDFSFQVDLPAGGGGIHDNAARVKDISRPVKGTPVPPLSLQKPPRKVGLSIEANDNKEDDGPVDDDGGMLLNNIGADKSSLLFRRKSKVLKVEERSEEEVLTDRGAQDTPGDAGNHHHAGHQSNGPGDTEVRLSPGGSTVQVGRWRIREFGLQHSSSDGGDTDDARKGSDAFLEVGALGSGASGTVVEALHLPTLTIVALKILPVHNPKKNHHLSQELAVLYRNLADLRLVDEDQLFPGTPKQKRRRQCPYVLSLYDAFVDTRSSKINLVMEFMDGGSLQDLVRNGGTKDEKVLADIAYQVLKGLQYLHGQHQMHRDIKPGNILLNCKGVVKVADFGISKAMDNTFGCAKSFVGTMCYMAPERIAARNYGFPADIWSMGLTLLTVALGEFPLPEKDQGFWGLMNSICDGEPPTAGSDFSDVFNDFIAKCLKKEPADRGTPSQLLKHAFLQGFREEELRLQNADDEDFHSDLSSRTSSPPPCDNSEVTPRTLSQLAAAKDSNMTRRLSDEQVTEVRLEHLKHILDMLQEACRVREGLDAEDEDFLDWGEEGGEQAAVRSPPRPIRLPNLEGKGAVKWKHLAKQLYLPTETVLSYAGSIIDKLYFADVVECDPDS